MTMSTSKQDTIKAKRQLRAKKSLVPKSQSLAEKE